MQFKDYVKVKGKLISESSVTYLSIKLGLSDGSREIVHSGFNNNNVGEDNIRSKMLIHKNPVTP